MNWVQLYEDLIIRAKEEGRIKGLEAYFEAHHIIPRCLGGGGKYTEWRTHPNIVLLTAKEHFLAHYYLTQIHPENSKLSYAFWAMCGLASRNLKRDYSDIEGFSEIYEEARVKMSAAISVTNKGIKRGPPSLEHRARIAKANKGKKQSPEAVAKAAESRWKPIKQYTKEGLRIKNWNSIKEASEALGIGKVNISSNLRGIRKSAGGFIWKYA
jgi:hypothetical protein